MGYQMGPNSNINTLGLPRLDWLTASSRITTFKFCHGHQNPGSDSDWASLGWFGQVNQTATSTAAAVATTCPGATSRVEQHSSGDNTHLILGYPKSLQQLAQALQPECSSIDNTQFDCLSGKKLPGCYWRLWWTHKILNFCELDI